MANYYDIPEEAEQFLRIWEAAEKRADKEADVLFAGQENPPAAELEIIFDSGLTFTDKVAKLQLLRGEKPKSFRKRLTDPDRVWAREMGIGL